jgi:hypothetical protein
MAAYYMGFEDSLQMDGTCFVGLSLSLGGFGSAYYQDTRTIITFSLESAI